MISRRLQWQVACLLFALVAISRLPEFFLSVLDWDESLYVIMAGQWQAGHLPYTTIWDNKPIGIYGIFLLFQTVFGNPVIAIRAATVAAITLTSFAVFRIALVLPGVNEGNRVACAVFAGVAFAICSLSNDGLAANTEIFMACFTAFAVVCAVSTQFCSGRPGLRGLAAGLLFGMAFMTKYVAIFEAPAIGFALVFMSPGDVRARVRACAGAVLGAAVPLLLTVLLYAATGNLKIWWDCSIASNFLRVATPISANALSYVLTLQLTRWLPLFGAALVLLALTPLLVRRILLSGVAGRAARFHMFLLLWLAGGSVGVAAAKLFYDHYFLQILPVLCVSLAWAVASLAGGLRRSLMQLIFTVLLVIPCFGAGAAVAIACRPIFVAQNGGFSPHPDTPALIARDISHLPAGAARQIYVFDYQPIIYSLARQTPPTRYAFPSVLTKCFLSHVAGVNAAAEVHRILAGDPEFIIRSQFPLTTPGINQTVYDEVTQDVAGRYEVWRSFSDAAIYRLRADAQPLGDAREPANNACG
jgi:4-amino-4-deoxy-L-arabinose transferase-like glycosyltransferase